MTHRTGHVAKARLRQAIERLNPYDGGPSISSSVMAATFDQITENVGQTVRGRYRAERSGGRSQDVDGWPFDDWSEGKDGASLAYGCVILETGLTL